jgi:hypothetical protein
MIYAPFARRFAKLAQQNAANTTWNTAKHALLPANAVPMLALRWRSNKTLQSNPVKVSAYFCNIRYVASVFIA